MCGMINNMEIENIKQQETGSKSVEIKTGELKKEPDVIKIKKPKAKKQKSVLP